MAAARKMMMMMIRGVKASKMAGAGLMGDLKVKPFSTITQPPPSIWNSTSAIVRKGADQGGIGIVKEEEEEEEEEETLKKDKEKEKEKVWKVDPVLEELAAARRKRKRGGPIELLDACNSERMKEFAIFGLDQINQREHTNLQLTRVLGAWCRLGPGTKYDITLEATDGGGKGNFYRVAVTDLYMFIRYHKLELVQWVLLDDPNPPIIPFEPGTYSEYVADMDARLESLCKARPPVTYPNRYSNDWVV